MKDKEIVRHLTKLKFIGPFPQGIKVLLVPIQNAVDEAFVFDSNLNRKTLQTLLKRNKVFVFRTIEEYLEVKHGPKVSI